MAGINIFRELVSAPNESKLLEVFNVDVDVDVDENEPVMDPAWPHLQIFYELFLRFFASPKTDAKIANRYIDHAFVLRLLDLFDYEDPRERDYLKMIFHCVYGNSWSIGPSFARRSPISSFSLLRPRNIIEFLSFW